MKNSERIGEAGTRKLTAAMYLRICSEDSDARHSIKTESDSIANQRSLLKAFISHTPELENADILEYCDDGWSGKNFERPAVRAMLEQARNGSIQCILVKDLSRFGRDYLEVGNYISRIFPFLGIRFIAVNDHLGFCGMNATSGRMFSGGGCVTRSGKTIWSASRVLSGSGWQDATREL